MTSSHTESHTAEAAPSPALASTEPYLRLDGITVRFPGVLALDSGVARSAAR